MESVDVLIGLGANLGHPLRQLRQAVDALAETIDWTRVSSVYRTEPVGFSAQPEFMNVVGYGRTLARPGELLTLAQAVEGRLGRERSFRNAPRSIDIDLLDYGGLVLESAELVLPHPRLTERGFVLVPLAEIVPEWRHPLLGSTPAELIARAGALERVERWGELPG